MCIRDSPLPQCTDQHHIVCSLAFLTSISAYFGFPCVCELSFSYKEINRNHACNNKNNLLWHCVVRACYLRLWELHVSVLPLLKCINPNLTTIQKDRMHIWYKKSLVTCCWTSYIWHGLFRVVVAFAALSVAYFICSQYWALIQLHTQVLNRCV